MLNSKDNPLCVACDHSKAILAGVYSQGREPFTLYTCNAKHCEHKETANGTAIPVSGTKKNVTEL